MDFLESQDKNLNKLREKLNDEKIKLWLPPYMGSDEKKDEKELEKLADSFSKQLSIPKNQCLQRLATLQTKALKTFKDHEKYLSTGEALLTVKVFSEKGEKLINVEMDLTRMGYDLKLRICRLSSMIPLRARVVFRGKILDDDLTLQEQDIKHGLQILALGLKLTCQGLYLDYDEDMRDVKAASDMVQLSRKGYIQTRDEFKKLSEMPAEQKKYLITGLRLHQIGREYIKKENFGSALAMLLEAEENFSHHEKSFLETLGNYLALDIDIVWCYLNLHCLLLLPEAGEILYQSEINLRRVYGSNFEHITPRTDFAWTALILVMRIHLMQAAVCYHRGSTHRAAVFLQKAEKELQSLKVNTRHVAYLIKLGYAQPEILFALRDSKGDVHKAVVAMERKRAEITTLLFEMMKKGQYLLKSELKENFGVPDNSEEVMAKCLTGMGCSEEVIKSAIEQEEYPDPDDYDFDYDYDDDDDDDDGDDDGNDDDDDDDDDDEESDEESEEDNLARETAISMKTVVTVGFSPKKARAALKKHGGNFGAAFRDLFKKEFVLAYERSLEVNTGGRDNTEEGPFRTVVLRRPDDPSRTFCFQFRDARLLNNIYPERTDNIQYDYIDIDLEAETAFIEQYKTLIKRAGEQL